MSFMCTSSRVGSSHAYRNTRRPMRPNPLTPTLIDFGFGSADDDDDDLKLLNMVSSDGSSACMNELFRV